MHKKTVLAVGQYEPDAQGAHVVFELAPVVIKKKPLSHGGVEVAVALADDEAEAVDDALDVVEEVPEAVEVAVAELEALDVADAVAVALDVAVTDTA